MSKKHVMGAKINAGSTFIFSYQATEDESLLRVVIETLEGFRIDNLRVGSVSLNLREGDMNDLFKSVPQSKCRTLTIPTASSVIVHKDFLVMLAVSNTTDKAQEFAAYLHMQKYEPVKFLPSEAS